MAIIFRTWSHFYWTDVIFLFHSLMDGCLLLIAFFRFVLFADRSLCIRIQKQSFHIVPPEISCTSRTDFSSCMLKPVYIAIVISVAIEAEIP